MLFDSEFKPRASLVVNLDPATHMKVLSAARYAYDFGHSSKEEKDAFTDRILEIHDNAGIFIINSFDVTRCTVYKTERIYTCKECESENDPEYIKNRFVQIAYLKSDVTNKVIIGENGEPVLFPADLFNNAVNLEWLDGKLLTLLPVFRFDATGDSLTPKDIIGITYLVEEPTWTIAKD